jgi:hypothetical protein
VKYPEVYSARGKLNSSEIRIHFTNLLAKDLDNFYAQTKQISATEEEFLAHINNVFQN